MTVNGDCYTSRAALKRNISLLFLPRNARSESVSADDKNILSKKQLTLPYIHLTPLHHIRECLLHFFGHVRPGGREPAQASQNGQFIPAVFRIHGAVKSESQVSQVGESCQFAQLRVLLAPLNISQIVERNLSSRRQFSVTDRQRSKLSEGSQALQWDLQG